MYSRGSGTPGIGEPLDLCSVAESHYGVRQVSVWGHGETKVEVHCTLRFTHGLLKRPSQDPEICRTPLSLTKDKRTLHGLKPTNFMAGRR